MKNLKFCLLMLSVLLFGAGCASQKPIGIYQADTGETFVFEDNNFTYTGWDGDMSGTFTYRNEIISINANGTSYDFSYSEESNALYYNQTLYYSKYDPSAIGYVPKEGDEPYRPIEQVDPFEGLEIVYSGYDGYGTVTLKTENCHPFAADYVYYTVSPNNGLKNGDTIEITAECDSYSCKRNYCKIADNMNSYTVTALDEITYVDPFENLAVYSYGYSPYATAGFNTDECDEWVKKYVKFTLPEGYIKNGMSITITCSTDDTVTQKTGKALKCTSSSYSINSSRPEYPQTLDETSRESVNKEMQSFMKAKTALTPDDRKIFDIYLTKFMSDNITSKLKESWAQYTGKSGWGDYTLNNYNISFSREKSFYLTIKENYATKSKIDYNRYVEIYKVTLDVDADWITKDSTFEADETGEIYVAVIASNIVCSPDKVIWGENFAEDFSLIYSADTKQSFVEQKAVYSFSDSYNINEIE